jgi:uncharacterized metal-binding protein
MAECCCGSDVPMKLLYAVQARPIPDIRPTTQHGGCSVACGKKTFENLGIPHNHYVITDYGVEKGKTEITSELIAKTAFALASENRR